MKKIISVVLLLIMLGSFSIVEAAVRVKGYHRKDGTYVQPHYRSSPNRTKFDNYSTKGNVNPYTGKAGTVDPHTASPSRLNSPPTSSYTTTHNVPTYTQPVVPPTYSPSPYYPSQKQIYTDFLYFDSAVGDNGEHVVKLQEFLIATKHLNMPMTIPKGYFGALTRDAVISLQQTVGIYPADGELNAVTRAYLAAYFGDV